MKGGSKVCIAYSAEDYDVMAAFVAVAFVVVDRGAKAEIMDTVAKLDEGMRLSEHRELMRNVRFLIRNGIPEWVD